MLHYRQALRDRAVRVYIILCFFSAMFLSLSFTVNMVYQVSVAHLNPLELVLVGTLLEASIFFFEIPTGILADIKSRKLSVVIGYLLIGAGFLLQGMVPSFWSIALSQVIWGLGYTFTSGATQAWVADEVGEERAAVAFIRGAKAEQAGNLVAIPISIGLGISLVSLPIIISGGLMILLALVMAGAMTETGFQPDPNACSAGYATVFKTFSSARHMFRQKTILRIILFIALFYGLYSEGFDRLWTAHVIDRFALPGGMNQVAFFGLLRGIMLVLGMVVMHLAQSRMEHARHDTLSKSLALLAVVIIISLCGFALIPNVWVVVLLYCVIGAARSITGPLYDIWFNHQVENSPVKATLFSIRSQMDAIGQIGGGPVVGVVGKWVSIPAALVLSATLLLPVLPLLGAAACCKQKKTAIEGIETGIPE